MTFQFASLTLLASITDIRSLIQFFAFLLLKVLAYFNVLSFVTGTAGLPIGKSARVA